jgi:hypothetical protein
MCATCFRNWIHKQVRSQYRGFREIFSWYWAAYGGFATLLASPYLHLAFVFTLLAHPRWMALDWESDVIGVVPSLLGFSLGGYAILLALGNASFMKLLVEEEVPEHQSYFMLVNISFLHFIIVQILAMILAFVGDLATSVGVGVPFAFLAYWVFIYSFFTALAATVAIFRLARVYNRFARLSSDRHDVEG